MKGSPSSPQLEKARAQQKIIIIGLTFLGAYFKSIPKLSLRSLSPLSLLSQTSGDLSVSVFLCNIFPGSLCTPAPIQAGCYCPEIDFHCHLRESFPHPPALELLFPMYTFLKSLFLSFEEIYPLLAFLRTHTEEANSLRPCMSVAFHFFWLDMVLQFGNNFPSHLRHCSVVFQLPVLLLRSLKLLVCSVL